MRTTPAARLCLHWMESQDCVLKQSVTMGRAVRVLPHVTASIRSTKRRAKDMRSTGANDVRFAMDAPPDDSTLVTELRTKALPRWPIADAFVGRDQIGHHQVRPRPAVAEPQRSVCESAAIEWVVARL